MNKKLIIVWIIALSLRLVISAFADSEYDFSGRWNWDTDGRSFSIDLWQDIDILRGEYSAIALNGDRIDSCDPDDSVRVNIFGVIKGNIAEVSFFSYYGIGMGAPGSCMGKARLVLKDNHIEWLVTEAPSNGYFWCPLNAILKRVIEH